MPVFLPIRSYDNYIQANLQLTLLKDNDITCHLKDEHTVTIDPFLSPALGGMKLMVLETDLFRAQTVLNQVEEAYIKTFPCPVCSSMSLERKTHVVAQGWWSRLVSRFRGNSSESVFADQIVCNACGHQLTNGLPY